MKTQMQISKQCKQSVA